MSSEVPSEGLQLRSTVQAEGMVEVALVRVPIPHPQADEVVVRVEASPINPSDLRVLFAGADVGRARPGITAELPSVRAPLAPGPLRAAAARVGQAMPAGNEGAGIVVAAGSSAEAQALLGQAVGVTGGEMYSQYRCVKVAQCERLPPGVTPSQGAAWFINPVTALCMLETLRREDHRALVHTAAASNLGQMMVRLCQAEGVPLVNVVRRPEQAETLSALGATHVCDSSQPSFRADLAAAIAETQATLAFDAIGGGTLASDILEAMEASAARLQPGFRRYGTTVHKQVYIYGSLDPGPTQLKRTYGLAWGAGGWLVTTVLERLGAEETARLRARAAAEVTTTFASHYAKEVSLAEMLRPEEISVYGRPATGSKYLVRPNPRPG
ncbi:MAG: NADH oxidase [Myxococcaceae bacterium]